MTDGWLAQRAQVECCDVTTTGRRSGRPHVVEIWFGVVDDVAYVVSGNGPSADWYRNIEAHPAVVVTIEGERREGAGRVVTDAGERRRVGEAMAAKYVWGGDASIGLTYDAWCDDVPAVAIELS